MRIKLLLAAMGISCFASREKKTGIDTRGTSFENPKTNDVPTKAQTPDIEKLLAKVAATPPPAGLSMGASCYRMCVPPEREEYICMVCGTKTIHSLNKSDGWDNPALSVKYYRTYIEELIKLGLDAKLDESFLCSKCKKEGQSSLFLEVTIKNRVVRSALVDINDLSKLIAFVQGNLVWKGERDEEFPLKPELPRIRQLLGIEK